MEQAQGYQEYQKNLDTLDTFADGKGVFWWLLHG
jgi:hypothetical protein